MQLALIHCSQDIFELLLTNTLATRTRKFFFKKIHGFGIKNFFPGIRPLAPHAVLTFYNCGRKDVKIDLEFVL